MRTEETKACFILTSAESIGPKTIDKMKLFAGSLAECMSIKPAEFAGAGILSGFQQKELETVFSNRMKLSEIYERTLSRGTRIIMRDDPSYPRRLSFREDAPALLFVRGSLPDENGPTASIVGSRTASEYGISAADFFSGELASNGVGIVSGLASGIDAAAAGGALGRGGKSFAVLGSGIDICYPRENYPLYEAMSEETHGGIITEFHPGREPIGKHFVMRNRIIAALGDVLIVIEARSKSGTSITVDFALSMGKEVFAMPGRINDPLGRGCNRLLKEGATPLTEPGDVLSVLGKDSTLAAESIDETRDIGMLTKNEQKIYLTLGEDARHIEDIARMAGFDMKLAITVLYSLELKGFAINAGSAYYKRNRLCTRSR